MRRDRLWSAGERRQRQDSGGGVGDPQDRIDGGGLNDHGSYDLTRSRRAADFGGLQGNVVESEHELPGLGGAGLECHLVDTDAGQVECRCAVAGDATAVGRTVLWEENREERASTANGAEAIPELDPKSTRSADCS